ncbi:hypothetical protein GCM10022276_14030 [Sphingomonas limnosediminicola]|uniref:Transposase n=1 Tax=Sphingomonas limnosediminicola TaxID=940133 RepID=A0ABP7L7A4_9SPHN
MTGKNVALDARRQKRQPHQPDSISGLRNAFHRGKAGAIPFDEAMRGPETLDQHRIAIWRMARNRLNLGSPATRLQHGRNAPSHQFGIAVFGRHALRVGKRCTDARPHSNRKHQLGSYAEKYNRTIAQSALC